MENKIMVDEWTVLGCLECDDTEKQCFVVEKQDKQPLHEIIKKKIASIIHSDE